MDFERDIKEQALAFLPLAPEDRAELEDRSASDVLIVWLNWQARLIAPFPRRAHLSPTLAAQMQKDPRFSTGVNTVVRAIELGADLTPHLSRDVRVAYERAEGRQGRRRRDLDLLLNDWGLHHLHLGTERDPDGFVRRTKALLVAAFHAEDAYLIEVVDHGRWTKESILDTVIETWPHAGIVYQLNGAIGLERTLTEEQRANIRRGHMMSAYEHATGVYMAGLGLTTAGTSARATAQASVMLRNLRLVEQRVAENPGYLAKIMAERGIIPVPNPEWHAQILGPGQVGLKERRTGFIVTFSG